MFKPLGDTALLVYLPTEADAVSLAASLKSQPPVWLYDAVPAYATLGVYYDGEITNRETVQATVSQLLQSPIAQLKYRPKRHTIPVRYDLGEDWEFVSQHTKLSAKDVIRFHTEPEYTVHAVGFVPGFPYLGYLHEALLGVPRLASPRVRVEPGSVGLTGKQTGIYPLARPGGWPLIGRTDFKLVDVEAGFFALAVGDKVRFVVA